MPQIYQVALMKERYFHVPPVQYLNAQINGTLRILCQFLESCNNEHVTISLELAWGLEVKVGQ